MSDAAHSEAKDPAGATRRVLVADGNRGRGQKLVDACTGAGYRCKLTPHGAAAIEVALATKPSLVVAQHDLPLVEAVKLAEILRANPRTHSVRFLFLGPGERADLEGAVGDRVLDQDASPETILDAIEEIFERQGRIDEDVVLDVCPDRHSGSDRGSSPGSDTLAATGVQAPAPSRIRVQRLTAESNNTFTSCLGRLLEKLDHF